MLKYEHYKPIRDALWDAAKLHRCTHLGFRYGGIDGWNRSEFCFYFTCRGKGRRIRSGFNEGEFEILGGYSFVYKYKNEMLEDFCARVNAIIQPERKKLLLCL